MMLRNYTDADFGKVKALLKKTRVYYQPLDKRGFLKKKIEQDPESIIVAEDSGELIATVFIIFDPWQSFIYHLAVSPEHRDQGIANCLMDEAEKRLKQRGIGRPTLFVEEENVKVVDFYKKRGWFTLYKTICMEKEL
jgi:ribosomal protein S18 acetylase RimI-like enzyme